MHKRVISGCVFALFLAFTPLRADDGAASIAAGGIVMKRESRITMAKEVLRISVDKVTVDYDFRNDTDQDITTEVPFPIPDYSFQYDRATPKQAGFDDFELEVNGKHMNFNTEVKAFAGKEDVTGVLRAMHVDIAGFGHYHDGANGGPVFPDLRGLSQSKRSRLNGLKAIDGEWPNWKVQKRYYWSQTFPAHTTVHISHRYTPVVGFGLVPSSTFNAAKGDSSAHHNDAHIDKDSLEEVKSVCPTDQLLTRLDKASHNAQDAGYGYIQYVDFILTTANTWKQPISSFTLLVERPHDAHRESYAVSFCWAHKVEQIEPDLFRATATKLVPTHELRVGFFGINK